jgi:LCP family protein required for cell wall assembly
LLFFLTIGIATYIHIGQTAKDLGLNVSTNDLINLLENQINSENQKLSASELLKKDSTGNKTNILLVGIDTRIGESSYLMNTDTIIVLSYNHISETLTMISIPRDTIVKNPTSQYSYKINTFYSMSEVPNPGTGLTALQEVVQYYTGIEIQYSAMINYKAFVQLIDLLGGVDVNIENSFTDYNFPGMQGYPLSFQAGPERMDGTRALQFARSRQSLDNSEGTDFARSRRQQLIINAVKQKVTALDFDLNLAKLIEIANTLQENVKFSGYGYDDINGAIELLKEGKINTQYSIVLDPNVHEGTLLYETLRDDLGYSILPSAGFNEYSEIQNYINLKINYPNLYNQKPTVSIYDCSNDYESTIRAKQDIETALKNQISVTYMGACTESNKGETEIIVNSYLQNNKDYTGAIKELINILDGGSSHNQTDFKDSSNNNEIIILSRVK